MDPVSGGKLEVRAAVRCLSCASVYSKPLGGGTISTNPGCPHCGYLGWVTAEAPPRGRSGGDLRQLRPGPPR